MRHQDDRGRSLTRDRFLLNEGFDTDPHIREDAAHVGERAGAVRHADTEVVGADRLAHREHVDVLNLSLVAEHRNLVVGGHADHADHVHDIRDHSGGGGF